MSDFLRAVQASSSDEPLELVPGIQFEAKRCKQQAVALRLPCSGDNVLCEFCTQQISQVLPLSMAASTHASNDGRVIKLVTFPLRNRMNVLAF